MPPADIRGRSTDIRGRFADMRGRSAGILERSADDIRGRSADIRGWSADAADDPRTVSGPPAGCISFLRGLEKAENLTVFWISPKLIINGQAD